MEPQLYQASKSRDTSSVIKLLLTPVNVNWVNESDYGKTPLHAACHSGATKIIELLLERSEIDVNCGDEYGSTPLSLACQWGHLAAVKMLLDDQRTDVNLADKSFCTPLWRAASRSGGGGEDEEDDGGEGGDGGLRIVEAILGSRREIDVTTRGCGKTTPLQIAKNWGYTKVAKLLEKYMEDPGKVREEIRRRQCDEEREKKGKGKRKKSVEDHQPQESPEETEEREREDHRSWEKQLKEMKHLITENDADELEGTTNEPGNQAKSVPSSDPGVATALPTGQEGIPSHQFYPSKASLLAKSLHHAPAKRHLSQLHQIALYHQGKVPVTYSAFGGPPIWKVFPRQQLAFEYQRERGGDGHSCCFSFEEDGTGIRKYLVTTYHDLWKRYKNMEDARRRMYEVIKEGRRCKLYFDLEFQRDQNKRADGDKMVEFLKGFALRELSRLSKIDWTQDCVVDLSSSSTAKFSRHLVFHTPAVAFENNQHVGFFVRALTNKLKAILESPSHDDFAAVAALVVTREDGARGFFIDEAVYTKNRLFRVYLSSKFGKAVTLQKSPGNQHASDTEEEFFRDSLVCCMGQEPKVLLAYEPSQIPGPMLDFSFVRVPFSATELRPQTASAPASLHESVGVRCPYPQVDKFILEQVSLTGRASFRSVVFYPAAKKIVYQIGGNRFCHNVGRHHKSNNVIYVADLETGGFFQKCLDPDCRNISYRSPLRPIPPHLNPLAPPPAAGLLTQDFDAFLDEIDDDALERAMMLNPTAWD